MARAKKKSALEWLTEQYADHPVYKIVAPMRADAAARAVKHARQYIKYVTNRLAEHNGDFNAAYPSPKMGDHSIAAQVTKGIRHNAECLVRSAPGKPASYRMGEPWFVVIHEGYCDRYIADTIQAATDQYDLFTLKLVRKIGPCISATIEGNHVWSESTITVAKVDVRECDAMPIEVTERWRTKQIENISKLGKYFPQWPTRLLKR